MFKNWFKKKEIAIKEEAQDNEFACIKYFVTREGLKVDVIIENFDKRSLSSLAYIVNSMNGSSTLLETLQIISLFFEQEGRHNELLDLYAMLNEDVTSFLTSNKKDTDRINSPCIKPSDML